MAFLRAARASPFIGGSIFLVALASASWVFLSFEGVDAPTPQQVASVQEAFAEIVSPPLHEYIEVEGGCGPYYEGECVRSFTGPGETYPLAERLRRGVVLKVEGAPILNGLRTWYEVVFEEPIRYPERVSHVQYVAAEDVRHFYDEGIEELSDTQASTTKRIIVDRSAQKLYAYDGEELFMEVTISTGIQLTPTPRGTFRIFKKTPTRYMQGPLPGISEKYYDLPGVPWNLYFTHEGAVIHGAYWHDKFGQRWSNGCVNVPLDEAQRLYEWAEVGMPVVVRD